MIELYQPPTAFGVPNLSPFCCKVETYLRMAGLQYEVKFGVPPRGPKKKVPWIVDGDNTVSDSSAIIRYLAQQYPNEIDAGLSDLDRARGEAIKAMLEERLYFCALWQRWISQEGFELCRPVFVGPLPAPLRRPIATLFRRQIKRNLWGQGIGRHSPEEIDAFAAADIDTFATLLGSNPYLLGSEPTSYDATAFGFMVNAVEVPLDTGMRRAALGHSNIVDYVARMKTRYFAKAS